jgi:hypothetical protein
MRTRPLLGVVAIALALLAAGCGGSEGEGGADRAGRVDVPEAWPTHEDELGFSLRHPPGWRVGTEDDLLITARSPDSRRVVAIAPFIAPAETTPRACLESAVGTFPALFPASRLQRVRPGSSGEEALAAVSYRAGGGPGRASLLCSLDGRAGMLYAIGAPAAEFAERRPELVRVLDSFSFTGATGEPAPPQVSYETFRDPSEAAFTVEVPRGFDVSGGLVRRSSVEVWPRLEAASPDGMIVVFAGDDDLRTYAVPNPTLEATGFSEGSEYSPGYGVTFVVLPYLSGAEYALEHARRRLGCEGFEQTGGGERPDLSSRLGAVYAENGFAAQRLEVGEVEFRCRNRPRAGYLLAGTLLTEAGGIGQWNVQHLYGWRAEPGSEDLARGVMKQIVASFRIDPQWAASQQELTGNVARIVSETSAEISETITSSYEEQQETLDEVYRDWSNYTLGQTDVRDPATGEEFKVESGHNYYWRRAGTDEVVGENVGERPDIDFELLEEF